MLAPWFAYRRTNHDDIHVHGYQEKGNISTPLELAVRNQVDRFNPAIDVDVIDRVPELRDRAAHLKQSLKQQITESVSYAYAVVAIVHEFRPQPATE